ncbi:MAG: SprT-like domain-containing protein [Nitrospinae bacterium]|nr:SprT-like domain-containing protein [Nitrospinota bacterium]
MPPERFSATLPKAGYPMSILKKSTVNPGTIILGVPGAFAMAGDVFKNIFRCRKKGLEFLGQVSVDCGAQKVKWEVFNGGYYDLFPCEMSNVQESLQSRLLGQVAQLEHLPDAHRKLVRNFLKECRAQARQEELEFAEAQPVDSHDLQAIFDRLNEEYFNSRVEAQVEWGKQVKIPNRRSFRFGSYDAKSKLIRIHPRLKQDFVPVIVLELTVFHEMCHQAMPPVRRNGQWQTHHKDFKRKEREYRQYREAIQWEKKHWIKLMAPAPE